MIYCCIHNTGLFMEMDLIEKFEKVLSNKWVDVCYSDYDISWNSELLFYQKVNYRILAMEIWLYLMRNCPAKRNFIKKVSKNLYKECKRYDIPQYGLKRICKRVARMLQKLLAMSDFQGSKENCINDIEIELCQKYRIHCCSDLNCSDNAERRYFYRSPIVYVREINTYVLVNLRKYLHDDQNDSYKLNQDIKYELLDYCPFCGHNLKKLRVKSDNEQELIIAAIKRWRDCGIGFRGEGETYDDPITQYGINFYDSLFNIAKILANKYINFCDKFGVDENGIISPNGTFVTVEKLFDLCERHSLYRYLDSSNIPNMKPQNFIRHLREKFRSRDNFSEDEQYAFTKCNI